MHPACMREQPACLFMAARILRGVSKVIDSMQPSPPCLSLSPHTPGHDLQQRTSNTALRPT